MSEIDFHIGTFLPDGWTLTHIINLEPSWQVNLRSNEHVVVASGETIEDALLSASLKIVNHDYTGTLFHLASHKLPERSLEGRSLLASLGLAKPPIRRRI